MRQSQLVSAAWSREGLFIILGVGLMTLMSQIFIPLNPIPITFQNIGFLIIGLTYTPRQAFLSFSTYLSLGALGVPVFCGFSSGFGIVTGLSGGFLLGFLIVGTLMAWVRERFALQKTFALIVLGILGQLGLYVTGICGLMMFMPFQAALEVGVLPFLLPSLAKSFITAGLLGYLKTSDASD